ncbi:hypothetical protein TNCV_269721 [Trichonephila clavipes]|nr:hypothetical protein TNCV_269721 [Trichonephila clavipes]
MATDSCMTPIYSRSQSEVLGDHHKLPPLLQTLKTTNGIKFQEILHYNMPGNSTVDNLDQAVQNFSNIVSDAINTSTSTRISKTSYLRLPINI